MPGNKAKFGNWYPKKMGDDYERIVLINPANGEEYAIMAENGDHDGPAVARGDFIKAVLINPTTGAPYKASGSGGDSSSLQVVTVVTGDEARPDAASIFWMGGDTQPTNMIEGDVWFGLETATPPEEPSAALHLFGTTLPASTMNAYSDGGGSLYTADRFYTTRPAGIRVLGLRYLTPSDAVGTWLSESLTFYAWTQDWINTGLGKPTWAAPVQSKVFSGTRVAGEWTEVLFDTPFTLPAVAPTASGADVVALGMRSSSGNLYALGSRAQVTPIESQQVDAVFLAEAGLPASVNSVGSATSIYYGFDLVYEVL